jgi:hypothetical protein
VSPAVYWYAKSGESQVRAERRENPIEWRSSSRLYARVAGRPPECRDSIADALLGAAPPSIIYAFLMDYCIAGLAAGATKG